jgi:hypothetical protein
VSGDYDGRQYVGIDLHRRRSVIVRTTEHPFRAERAEDPGASRPVRTSPARNRVRRWWGGVRHTLPDLLGDLLDRPLPGASRSTISARRPDPSAPATSPNAAHNASFAARSSEFRGGPPAARRDPLKLCTLAAAPTGSGPGSSPARSRLMTAHKPRHAAESSSAHS